MTGLNCAIKKKKKKKEKEKTRKRKEKISEDLISSTHGSMSHTHCHIKTEGSFSQTTALLAERSDTCTNPATSLKPQQFLR